MPENPAGLVYGTLLVATLLSAESTRLETYPKTVGGVALAMLLYWIAHAYAQYTGERIERSEHFSYAGLARTAWHEMSLLGGAAVPLVLLLIMWAAGTALSTAVLADVCVAAAMIVAIEILIAVRAELTGRDLIRHAVVGATLGLLVIALRVLLH